MLGSLVGSVVVVLMLASGALAAPATPCSDPVAYTAPTADGKTTVVYVSLCDRVYRSTIEPQWGDGSGPSSDGGPAAAEGNDCGPGTAGSTK